MTQKERVYNYMKEFGTITQAQAFTDLGVYRLAARIAEMKASGIPIKTEQKTGKNRYGEAVCYAEYSLKKD